MQRLPEVDAISREDSKYLTHLDCSMRFLYDRLEDLAQKLEKAKSPHHVLCHPWLPAPEPAAKESSAVVEQDLNETGARLVEFIDAALHFVNIDSVYDPKSPSRYAKVLFERSSGSIDYAQIDFGTQDIIVLDRSYVQSRKELLCREGIEKVMDGDEEQPIFLVSTPLRQLPYDAMRYHVAGEIHAMMENRFPGFYENLQSEHGPDASAIDPECHGAIIIDGEPVTEIVPVQEFEISFGAIAGEITEGDPRLN